MHMNSLQPAAVPDEQSEYGVVIDGETDLDALITGLAAAGTRSVELTTGPQQLVGLHLGAIPRHGIRDGLSRAGIGVVALAPGIELRSDHPDEGIVADIDAHLKLAEDVGAARLKLVIANGMTADASLAAGTAHTDVPGATEPADRVSARLTAMLPRAAELGVRLVVENSGPAASARALAAMLDTASALAQEIDAQGNGAQEAVQLPGVGAVWNVKASIAAGETLADSAKALWPFLTAGNGYIRCDSVQSATALIRAVPDVAQVPLMVGPEPDTAT